MRVGWIKVEECINFIETLIVWMAINSVDISLRGETSLAKNAPANQART